MAREKLHRCRDWIFDWSGTLVDDLTLVLDATNHVLRQYGVAEMTRDGFRRRFRLPYEGFYQELLPGVPLEELEDHFREGFADSESRGVTTPLLPHALDFLEHLAESGRRMFVLTSMDPPAFERHKRDLGVEHFFEATYAGVLDKREQIGTMIEECGMEVERTVFLGDMEHDVETARHGGVLSVALLTGYQLEEALEKSTPDVLAQDLAEVKGCLTEKSV